MIRNAQTSLVARQILEQIVQDATSQFEGAPNERFWGGLAYDLSIVSFGIIFKVLTNLQKKYNFLRSKR